MKIEKDVNEIVYEVLKKHGISMDMIRPEKSIMDDLKAESLDIIEMMLAFEDKFKININEEDISQVRSVGDIYKYVKNNFNQ